MSDVEDQRPVELEQMGNRLDMVQIELAELMERYQPVKVTDNAFVVQQMADPVLGQTPEKQRRAIYREIGTTGQSAYTGMGLNRLDYNAELQGRQGLLTYDKMRKGDGQIKGVMRVVKTPILGARWYIEPASQSRMDQAVAKFIWDNLTKRMTNSFPELLSEVLLMLEYGFYTFEKVFEKDPDGMVFWRKFAARHPLDVLKWDFDDHGGPKGVWYMSLVPNFNEYYIPIWKLALFTYDKEAGDVTGTSVLRAAYKHWFIKDNLYKIDAIQKERHSIGVPVIMLPPNFDDGDVQAADE